MQIRQVTLKDIEALLPLYEDLGYPTTASSLTRYSFIMALVVLKKTRNLINY